MNITGLLFRRSFRQNWRRLLLTMLAISIGVTILLVFTEMFHGIGGRSTHATWRTEIFNAQSKPQTLIKNVEPLYVTLHSNSNTQLKWQNKTIDVAAMAATDVTSPSLPGLPTPAAGEYYVSPALKTILKEHPEDRIGARYGTTIVGTIPNRYLTAPDELAVVFGISLATAKNPISNAVPIYRITNPTTAAYSGYDYVIMTVLYLGIFILLFPVMLFISISTQLGNAQREQRYAALRLIGATKAQIRQIMLFETLIAAAAGITLAFLPYAALQPVLHNFQFDGLRFWPGDMVVPFSQIVGIILATLAFTAVANWRALRHVETSPLGVVRRQRTFKQPKAWRLLPLLIGLGLAVLALAHSSNQNMSVFLIFTSVVFLMFGLIMAGPYVTQITARFIARLTQRAETLLGMKYIAQHPQAVFRSVAGVTVALFAGSFYLTTVSGIENLSAKSVSDNGYSRLSSNTILIVGDADKQLPSTISAQLRQAGLATQLTQASQNDAGVITVACSAAPTYMRVHCPPDTNYVSIDFSKSATAPVTYSNDHTSAAVPVLFATIDTAKLDLIRSIVASSIDDLYTNPVSVINGAEARIPVINPIIKELASLAYIGIAITMAIAIVSLVVSTLSGLLERRRSLVTLRLGGMTVRSLQRVVIVESLVPLLTVTVVSAALGVSVGFIMMQTFTTTAHAVLSGAYVVLFLACIAGAIIAIVSLLPSINRIANIETNRTE